MPNGDWTEEERRSYSDWKEEMAWDVSEDEISDVIKFAHQYQPFFHTQHSYHLLRLIN